MKQALFIIGVLFCGMVCAAQPKIIDLSWSNPTIDFLQKNLSAMENSSPLNGITIRVRGESILRKGKKYFAGESLWTASKVEFKHFAKDITALKKLPFKKFTDNFYYSTTYYYDLDWYDDAAWARAAANFGVAARVCREAGLKGILLDIEEYGKRFWNYDTTSRKEDFKTTCKIVYKRDSSGGRWCFQTIRKSSFSCLSCFLFLPEISRRFSSTAYSVSCRLRHGSWKAVKPTVTGLASLKIIRS